MPSSFSSELWWTLNNSEKTNGIMCVSCLALALLLGFWWLGSKSRLYTVATRSSWTHCTLECTACFSKWRQNSTLAELKHSFQSFLSISQLRKFGQTGKIVRKYIFRRNKQRNHFDMTKLSSGWRNGLPTFNLTLGPRQTGSEGWGWDFSVAWEQIPSLDEKMPLHLWTERNGPQTEKYHQFWVCYLLLWGGEIYRQ